MLNKLSQRPLDKPQLSINIRKDVPSNKLHERISIFVIIRIRPANLKHPNSTLMKNQRFAYVFLLSLLFIQSASAQDARWGYQLSFDGSNDYMTANNVSPAVTGSDWTIEFWFKSARLVSYTESIVAFNSTTATNRIEIGLGSGNRMYIYTQNSSPTTLYGSTVISVGTWYHVAVVYNNSTREISMYLDAANIAEIARTVPLADVVQTNDRFSLAQEWDNAVASGFFAGQMDEVRIWTTARTTAQIADNRFREIPVNSASLAAYYKMTNNTGTTVTDNTGLSRTGTLVGGAAWQTSTVTKSSNGTMSADQTIDEGEAPSDITISNTPYANILWQTSANNVDWNNIAGATTATLSSAQTGTLTNTTYYRARLDNGYSAADFSDVVTVNVDISTLPVQWLSFDASVQHDKVELSWKTTAEDHNRFFEVERSTTGSRWEIIGQCPASNSDDVIHSYSFRDLTPEEGNSLYRIKQVDIDGKSSYSRVIKLYFTTNPVALRLFPNPVTNGRLNIQLNAPADVRIVDAAGNLITRRQMAAGQQAISVEKLATGMYWLQANGRSYPFLIH